MTPGIHSIPLLEYHAGPGVSKSQLDWIAQCPALLEWSRAAPVDDEAKSAVNIGQAFHALLLEPERFALEYAPSFTPPRGAISTVNDLQCALLKAGIPFKANASKAALTKLLLDNKPDAPVCDALAAEWEKAAAGRIVLSPAEWRKLELMRGSVMAHPGARRLIEMEGGVERCHFWRDPITGELCRSRPDKTIPNLGICLDVKTAADASERGFGNSIHEYRYHVQDAFYTEGNKHTLPECTKFLFLVVGTTRNAGRYPVHLRELPEEQRQMGRETYQADLATYSECRKSGKWPSVEVASLPNWFLGQHAMEAN